MTAATQDKTSQDKNQDAIIDFLSRPQAYGGGADATLVAARASLV